MKYEEVLGVCLDFSASHQGVLCRHPEAAEGLRVHFRASRTDVLVEHMGELWCVWASRSGGREVGTVEELRGALGSLWETGPRRWP